MDIKPYHLEWQVGTLLEARQVAVNVRSMIFSLPAWQLFAPGQHMDVRLTAPGGYQAQRSYSIASIPRDTGRIELAVELLENGEVSPYLWSMQPGAQLEMRGPIGGHFVWNPDADNAHAEGGAQRPLMLIAGGAGMVPFVSMIREHAARRDQRPVTFLISARTAGHVLYKEEMERIAAEAPHVSLVYTFTQEAPAGWTGYARRIDEAMFAEVFGSATPNSPVQAQTGVADTTDAADYFICGPTAFVEAAAHLLVKKGVSPHTIRTERFG